MKLSQLRALSWCVALIACGGFGFWAWIEIQAGMKLSVPEFRHWDPPAYNSEKITESDLLREDDIERALAIILQRTPPPIEKKLIKAEPVITINPDPVEAPLNIKLALVAYDDRNEKKSMAFLFDTAKPFKQTPFFVNEKVYHTDATLSKIFKDHVVLRRASGKEVVLYPENALQGATGGATATVVSRPPIAKLPPPPMKEPEPLIADAEEKPPRPPNNLARKIKFRQVPSTRSTISNERYGVTIAQYDEADPELMRFAISAEDQVKMEGQQLQLVSEQTFDIAYDSSGKVIGLKLSHFNVSDPLLGQFGIKEGDILTHFNNSTVDSFEKLMGIYNTLDPKKRDVHVKLRRNEVALDIKLEMDDFKSVAPPANAQTQTNP